MARPDRPGCVACGQPLSRYATTCPRCGAAQPHKRMGSTVGLAVLILGLVLYLLYAFLAGEPPQP